MAADEDEYVLGQVQAQQSVHDEELVARRNAQVMGSIDAMLGV